MVSDANTFAREWWLAFIHVDCWGTLRISSRWWICLPIDWFSSLGGKFPDGKKVFGSFRKIQLVTVPKTVRREVFPNFNFRATHKTFLWARWWFFSDFPKNFFEDFSRAVCFSGIYWCELGKTLFSTFTSLQPGYCRRRKVVLMYPIWMKAKFLINMISFTSEALTVVWGGWG